MRTATALYYGTLPGESLAKLSPHPQGCSLSKICFCGFSSVLLIKDEPDLGWHACVWNICEETPRAGCISSTFPVPCKVAKNEQQANRDPHTLYILYMFRIGWDGIGWDGIPYYTMVWYNMMRNGMVPRDAVWYGVIQDDMTRCSMNKRTNYTNSKDPQKHNNRHNYEHVPQNPRT